MRRLIFSLLIITSLTGHSQSIYENGSILFGLGGLISVGLQEELGFQASIQYTNLSGKIGYRATYSRYFVNAPNANDSKLDEFALDFLHRIITYESFQFYAHIGYIVNNYEVLRAADDTSRFFISDGSYNHGLQLGALVRYPFVDRLYANLGIQFKSFGKRYDTVNIGLTYTIGL